MADARTYYVYILASSRHGTLYIGVTGDLHVRLDQHRAGRGSDFVKKYGVHRLVRVETFLSPQEAITREKQLKNWQRDWKIRLIEEDNPDWSDLSHLLDLRWLWIPAFAGMTSGEQVRTAKPGSPT